MDFFDGLTFPAAGKVPYGHHRAHTPLYFGLQFNLCGRVHLRINHRREYNFDGPVCFLTHPGAFFEYDLIDRERHDFLYFCFTGVRAKEYCRHGLIDVEMPPVIPEHVHAFRENLLTLIRLREENRYPETVNLLENILLDLQLQLQRHQLPFIHQSRQLEELVKRMNLDLQKEWDFEREAAKMNISLSHFRRIFRKFTGSSPQHFILQQKLEKAAMDLRMTEKQVREIAAEIGFEDMYHFSHLFKKYYGVSPRIYRQAFWQI